MKHTLLRLHSIFIGLLAFGAMSLSAQDAVDTVRPVYSVFTLQAGSSHLADTYLTPLKYSGWQTALGYERLQAMKFSPEKWVMRLKADLQLDRTMNPVRNATMWYGGLEASWGMTRRFRITERLTVGAGATTAIQLGCLLNSRNGNNPASAKADWTIGANGFASWTGRLGRLHYTLRDDLFLPVAGIFFAPQYGELYYEIWLGNRSGLVHPAWWGNYFRVNNTLTADLHLGATTLRVGYGFDMNTSRVNHITSRRFRHSFILGIASEIITLSRSRGLSPAARIISAY